ncbi:MAG: glycosyltransferase family 9 protein [FCB group bacterium]|jgi:heptosyltransferase-2
MGDVILTTAFLRILRHSYPQSDIDFLVSSKFKEILENNPNINNLIEYDKSKSILEILKYKQFIKNKNNFKKYDIVIDLQNNLRSFIFSLGLGIKKYRLNKQRLNKLSLVFLKKPLKSLISNIPEIYINSVPKLGLKDDSKGLEFWFPEDKINKSYPGETTNSPNADNLKIAIAPGAHHYTKRWFSSRFSELINQIIEKYNAEIYLIGGVDDKPITDQIKSELNFEINDFSNSSSILKTAGIISQCNLLITNDTGVMHIAAARNVPVIAIFGSSVKDFGFTPYRVPNTIVEKEVPCRPCSHIGRSKCPKKHFNCMMKIQVEDVLSAVTDMLMYGN